MATGGYLFDARAMMPAPIRLKGMMTLPMGRDLSELSPVSTEKNGFPASTPESSLIVVPELPQSMTSPGSIRPSIPLPLTTISSPRSSISTPRDLNAFNVLMGSSALRKFFITLLPLDKDEKITDLCDIDLSGGGVNSP